MKWLGREGDWLDQSLILTFVNYNFLVNMQPKHNFFFFADVVFVLMAFIFLSWILLVKFSALALFSFSFFSFFEWPVTLQRTGCYGTFCFHHPCFGSFSIFGCLLLLLRTDYSFCCSTVCCFDRCFSLLPTPSRCLL